MNKSMLIKNGRIIDPSQGLDMIGDLLVSGGKIKSVAEIIKEIPADCSILMPGIWSFALVYRFPPPFKAADSRKKKPSQREAGLRSGRVYHICRIFNTSPALDNKATIDYIKAASAADACIRVLQSVV